MQPYMKREEQGFKVNKKTIEEVDNMWKEIRKKEIDNKYKNIEYWTKETILNINDNYPYWLIWFVSTIVLIICIILWWIIIVIFKKKDE